MADDVTCRPPGAHDDETAGYHPGDLWVTPADGRMWINRQNSPGRAVWQLSPEGYGYPAQALAGEPPRAVYGTRRLHGGYTGPLLRVAHPVSGRTREIGSLPCGDIDRNAMWSMLEGATHLQVSVVFEQMGSGDHATQELAEHRPVITPLAQLGNSVPIVFDGVIEGKRIKKQLDLPATLQFAVRSHAQVAVSSFRAFSNSTGLSTLFSAGERHLSWGCAASNDSFMMGFGTNYVLTGARVPSTPFVSGYSAAGPGGKTFLWLDSESLAGGPAPDGQLAGGTIGEWFHGGGHGIELSALMFHGRAISQAADMPRISASLNHYFGLTPQLRDRVWCEGDSLTAGYGAALDQNYPRQLRALLRRPARIYNTGAFGQGAGRRAGYVAGKARLFFQPGARNIFVLWAGTNDLNGNASANEIYESLSLAISAAREAGFKTVMVTIAPRKSFLIGGQVPGDQERERQILNGLILANAIGADAIADVAGDPVIGRFEATSNRDYYMDTVHFTSLGYAFVASTIARQVNQLL